MEERVIDHSKIKIGQKVKVGEGTNYHISKPGSVGKIVSIHRFKVVVRFKFGQYSIKKEDLIFPTKKKKKVTDK